jgi:uncharacterized Fe-S cluster-containing radical SAM superfamily protein
MDVIVPTFLFDPIQRAQDVEKIVMQDDKRMYYRFRYAKFYGGVVTADAVGCCLLCAYCWNYAKNDHPEGQGKFYAPYEVAEELIKIANKHKCFNFRLSGCEPFLGRASKDHLFDVIRIVQQQVDGRFVIETNGVLLGAHPKFLDEVPADCKFRIALKADNPEIFEKVTGANRTGLDYQLKGIQAVRDHKLGCRVATMTPFADITKVKLHPAISTEKEPLSKYAGTAARLKARGL